MAISRKEAYDILELPDNASNEDITRSYKSLLIKWYPDRHGNTEQALNKFKQIHIAYRKLVGPALDEADNLSMKDMLSLFHQVFFGEEHDLDGNEDSDWDDDSIEISDSDGIDIFDSRKTLTAEEARQNAESLIAEEEREKRKAEKRRAKKKRRKEKKKLEKERSSKLKDSQAVNGIPSHLQNSKSEQDKSIPSSSSSETEEEDIDRNSAFVAVAATKSKKLLASERYEKKSNKRTNYSSHIKRGRSNHLLAGVYKKEKENIKQAKNRGNDSGIDPNSAFVAVVANKSKRNISAVQKKAKEEKSQSKASSNGDVQSCKDIDPTVLRSRQVAIRGNEMAGVGEYQEAINLFTEAIKLDPNDHRFFGNRSYCYDRLCYYERALKDAEKAIALAPRWPKGYFRKGRALAGLKKFTEAEAVFQIVLELDANCGDAEQELFKVRVLQLTEMGFSKQKSELAIRHYQHVQPALDALLTGVGMDLQAVGGEAEVYISDEDDFYPQYALSQHITDEKMDPRNPEGQLSLWVGNVRQEVTEKMLRDLFTKFGDVISVHHLPEKYCAFVNYTDKSSAGRAMQALQGYDCCGQQLLIRYPNNPISSKTNPAMSKKAKPSGSSEIIIEQPKTKVSGPVNGDECYFWRTTGCTYGDQCRYKHVQQHQGIDKKPWHG